FETLWHLLAQPIPRGETARLGVSIVYQYAAAGITQPELAQLLTEARRSAADAATHEGRVLAPQLRAPRSVARSLVAPADGLSLRGLPGGLSPTAAADALAAADGLSRRVLLGGLSANAAEEALRGALDRAVG